MRESNAREGQTRQEEIKTNNGEEKGRDEPKQTKGDKNGGNVRKNDKDVKQSSSEVQMNG